MPARSVRAEEDLWRAFEPRRPAREYGFVRPNDELWITSQANTLTIGTFTAVPIGWIEILPLWGGTPVYRRIVNTNSRTNRSAGSDGPLPIDTTGWIVDGGVTLDNFRATAFKRGMLFASLRIRRPADDRHWTTLAAGYLVGDRPNVPIGRIEPSGPGGGEGFRSIVTLATNVAGNVNTTTALNATDSFRRIHGFIWYYNASATVATRTLEARVTAPYGTKPTGFTLADLIWQSASVTLTASEEAIIYAGRIGFNITNDTTSGGAETIVYQNNTTTPSPFPFDVLEDATVDLTQFVSAGEATDVYSAYADIEEWLVL